MSILSFSNLGQSFGDFDVFLGLTASIPNDGKVGLVGANGIGKTTLLRILAGLEQSSSGTIQLTQGTRIGYLRQEAMQAFAQRQNTVYGEMLTVFGEVRTQEKALQALQERMAHGEPSDELLAEYDALHHSFEVNGGYEYETRISQVLQGLGFSKAEWETPLSVLSGGQKTRALLARLLLEHPTLLILDEPTNHLDFSAVEWLEGMLQTWDGALLVVSHDRYFLDRVVNRIWEMSRSGLEEYRGNYSAYLRQRQERWERREVEFEAIREKFLKELDYVKRNIARDATKDQAQGRLTRLIREVRVVEQGGLSLLLSQNWGKVMEQVSISEAKWGVADAEGAIKALQNPITRPPRLNMHLKAGMRSGNLVLRTSEVHVGYPEKPLFTAEPIILHRGECAALIGPNGTGKTTFLRTITGELLALGGEIRLGASLKVGYFAQAHEKLDPNKTVLETLIDHKFMLIGPARNYLAQYLFRGEDVYKPVHLLSGGERGRLALALLALEDANFLLLDEPTNHLDIPAQEALQQVLEAFPGTILMVSHDRYLIDQLATQIWVLDHGKLSVFPGTYAEMIEARARTTEEAKQVAAQQRAEARREQGSDRQSKNDARKRAKALADQEAEIHRLEQKLAQLETDLSNEQDVATLQRLGTDYTATQQALEQAMEAWSELAAA